ncbi:MAG: hypothetical protein KF836_12280 [Fimbriimonadaceae bacterium]|nr:hypothetical protein [Fimbriimonadaceae bacterium]
MKVSGYEVTETSDGLILQKNKPSYLLIIATVAIIGLIMWIPVWNGRKTSQEALWDALFYIVGFAIVLLLSRPWLRKKQVRVSLEERAIFLNDQKVPFEEITAISTERAWFYHDVTVCTQDKPIVILPWVTQYNGTRLCEIICIRLPEKESLRLMPWGVSTWADSQRQTPTQ